MWVSRFKYRINIAPAKFELGFTLINLCDSGLTDNEIGALFFKLDSNNDNRVSALLRYHQAQQQIASNALT